MPSGAKLTDLSQKDFYHGIKKPTPPTSVNALVPDVRHEKALKTTWEEFKCAQKLTMATPPRESQSGNQQDIKASPRKPKNVEHA